MTPGWWPAVSTLTLSLNPETVAASAEAASEIARFDAELGAEIAPFATVLLRSESAASSRIENLTASARAIGEATLGIPTGHNAREVAGNVAAMQAAVTLAEDMNPAAILAMHRALLGETEPGIAGRWRTEQVWIGGSALGPHHADFVPPHDELVLPLIEDLVVFCRRTDLPVLAHTAIAHAQFETIHPFPDGNGRTGRALMHAMLRHHGLVRNVTIPISAGLLVDTDDYFAALTDYRAGRPDAIVERVTEATFAALGNGRQLIDDLRGVRAAWNDRIQVRRDAASWQVADLLIRQPVINAARVSAELGIAPGNVYRAVTPLVEAEVLVSSGQARDRVWRAPEVLSALDAFAARAGRRGRTAR